MKRLCILIFFVAAAMPSVAGFTEDALLDIWSVDPLVKVFRDAVFVPDTRADVHAARGETATFQLVIRPRGPLDALTIGVSSFVRETGASMATPVKIRFVGYVNVDRPMQKPCGDQLRQPPADYPDVLLEREVQLAAWAEHGAERKVVPYTVATNMDTPNPDPGEDYPHVNTQLFGIIDPPTNRGQMSEQMNAAVFAFRRYEDASLRYTGILSHDGLTHYGLYDTVVAKD